MNRYDIFKKNFKWVYRNFNGSYDMNNDPELFADTMKAYYDWSKAIPTDKIFDFCKHIAQFEKMPSMAQWNDTANRFIRDPEIKTPEKEKSEKEKREVGLQNDIITGLWPLFGTLEGRCAVARLYAWTCKVNGLTLPDYWKQHLVYAPMPELKADYFERKPFTKQEMRVMGGVIDRNNKDKNGRPVLIGRKLGSIVSGFFVTDNTRKRKY